MSWECDGLEGTEVEGPAEHDAQPTFELCPEAAGATGETGESDGIGEMGNGGEAGAIEDHAEIQGSEIAGFQQSIEDVNPGFDPFDPESPFNTNCSSCALATELRLSGVDPEAVAGPENIAPTGKEMSALTGMEQVELTPEQIEDYARLQGPGYHGIVGFDYTVGGGGHWVNVATGAHGDVYAIDSQNSTVEPWHDFVDRYITETKHWDLSIRRER